MNRTTARRPLNVVLRHGSSAEKVFLAQAGLPMPEALVPGLPPTPQHDLINHGGRTISALRFVSYYVGAVAWAASDIGNIDRALAAAMRDAGLNGIMQQYFTAPITTAFDGSEPLPGPAPAIVSQGDIEARVADLDAQGKFGNRDLASTVFVFLLPPGTVLNTNAATTGALTRRAGVRTARRRSMPADDKDDSLHGLGGFHGSVHTAAGRTVYYAVGVYSETRPDGTVNGIPVFDQAWKNVVATFYHELNEARTDPDVEDAIRDGSNAHLGWVSRQGEECGDFPVFEAGADLTKVFKEIALADGSGTVPVQCQYSNRVHGPECP
ncbi:MAG TPA: hypothetical protein VKW09_10240 [bacterium]|nr:hypothetical protein [bacterium]